MLAIGCGYPDGNEFDWAALRPGLQAGVRTPARQRGGPVLAAAISRWENALTLREIIRLTYALVDIWCRSYARPPRSVVFAATIR
jgi:hypothetical protein